MTPASLIALRKRMKLTQEALAEALGLGRRTLIRYESGDNPIPKHISLAMSAIWHRLPDPPQD